MVHLWLKFLLFFFLFACTNNSSQKSKFNFDHFIDFIAKNHKSSYSKVLIIPGSGCEGCISQAEQFALDHSGSESGDLLIVFTNIVSVKLLKLRLGPALDSNNIILDTKNSLQYRSIYPVMLVFDSKGIVSLKELKPSESIL